jgi:hypothetical protein
VVWVFFDGISVGAFPALRRGTGCWFPCDSVYVQFVDGRWDFRSTESDPPEPMALVDIFAQRNYPDGLWASTSATTVTWINDRDDVIASHPSDFLPSLESWMSRQPDGESTHSRALQTIRALKASRATPTPVMGYHTVATTKLWTGVIHTLLTAGIAFLGIAAGLAWANQAAVRRIAAAREAANRCPRCSYDIRGLRDPRCPECGGVIRPLA